MNTEKPESEPGSDLDLDQVQPSDERSDDAQQPIADEPLIAESADAGVSDASLRGELSVDAPLSDVQPSSVATAETSVSMPTSQRKGMGLFSKFILALSLVCALAAGGAAAWIWDAGQKRQSQQQASQQQFDHTLQEQRRQIADLSTKLTQLEARNAKWDGALAKTKQSGSLLLGRMAAVESQVTELTGAHRVDWMLKEAEHFVVVAERRLSLLSDINGALALLSEADNLVKDMFEPSTRTLREALARDIMALRESSTAHVDSEGIFARIELLVEKVQGLKKAMLAFSSSDAAVNKTPAVTEQTLVQNEDVLVENSWGRFINRVRGFATSIVRVQIIDDSPIRPLLNADQQEYLRQNILVLLEQAQLSLLRSDYVGFKLSLRQAKQRIEQYLRVDAPEVTFVLAELEALSKISMVTSVPSMEGSVRALQVFREFWQQEKVERQLPKHQLSQSASSSKKAR